MSPLLSLIQVELCPSCHNIFLMLEIFNKYLFKIEHLGLSIYQRQHYGSETFLKLCELIELIKDNIGIDVLFKLYDYFYIITR